MDFRGRVWKMTCFGLKQGRHLENRAAHPRQQAHGSSMRCERGTQAGGEGANLPTAIVHFCAIIPAP